MKFGLVELLVDVRGIAADRATTAVCQGIRRDPGRAAVVRNVLHHTRRLCCDFVVLPGWSLVADRPPAWLLELSTGRTIIVECLAPASDVTAATPAKGRKHKPLPPPAKGAPVVVEAEVPAWCFWSGYVVQDGRVVVGPAPQYVAEAAEPWDGDELSASGAALVRDLQVHGPAGRRWTVPRGGDAMLLICGEANIVAGGGPAKCRNYETVEDAGLTEANFASVRLVANPAHTRAGPQALRDKRAGLSRGGVLLHTANTHGAGWVRKDASRGKASHRAAMAWLDGEAVKLIEEHRDDKCVVKTLEWCP